MAREFKRTDRVGSQMQRELAELLRTGLDVADLGMVTIQEVRVVRDFSHAKVFFTLLASKLNEAEATKLLNQAAPSLRYDLGQKMRLRSLPKLQFVYDVSVEQGAHLTNLINRAVASDKKNDE